MKRWTQTELDLLRSAYPHHSGAVVAATLGRSLNCVHKKASKLGLGKSPEFLARDAAERVQRMQQHPVLAAGQFKKGMVPWNKGLPGSEWQHPNSQKTQFKPREPHEALNYLPIGSHRLTHEGYLERKVTDDRALKPARRWVPVHRLVWQEAHGPIPAGHVVAFKPGTFSNVLELITADKLECITRAENARRNSPSTKNPELYKVFQLKGAITRQVNRIIKESKK